MNRLCVEVDYEYKENGKIIERVNAIGPYCIPRQAISYIKEGVNLTNYYYEDASEIFVVKIKQRQRLTVLLVLLAALAILPVTIFVAVKLIKRVKARKVMKYVNPSLY